MMLSVFPLALLLGSNALASVTIYTSKPAWQAAVGEFTTIPFAGFPDNTLIAEQYADLGVHFTDGGDFIHVSASYTNDGVGLRGGFMNTMTIEFDEPLQCIAMDFPGDFKAEFYWNGQIFFVSDYWWTAGTGNFGGFISALPFDKIRLFSDDGSGTVLDDLFFRGAPLPSNDNCVNATLKGVGSHPFSTIGATTDGPNEPGLCNFNGYSQLGNDVWFKFLAQCTGTATASTCGAPFNTKIAVYGNCPVGSGEVMTCNDDSCGTASEVSFPVVAGQLYRIRIGGFNNAVGQGTLVLSCAPGGNPCPADINNDNSVNVADLLAVINAWGPCASCPADVNNDGQVNVADLLSVINAWGACPA